MSDRSLRLLERRAEPAGARLLAERMRAGQLDPRRVELAAGLGHPAARLLRPDVGEVNWTARQARRFAVRTAGALVGMPSVVRWAADVAERVLPAWEANHPDDPRPREAIEAARAWAACPCQDHADAAVADTSAAAVAYAADSAAATSAATSAAAVAVAATSAAAADAAATYAADAAADAAEDSDAERKWQRLRLAAYLLEEVS